MSAAMTPERWARVQAAFDEVSAAAPDARLHALDLACGDDVEMRALVESLLQNAEADDSTLERAVSRAIRTVVARVDGPAPQKRIGPYEIVSELGRGGMGTVYLARRADDEFRQQVAIKLVRGFLDADRVRRFRAERQILASLDHANIARLLDGGTTEDGSPYLVMEHVHGAPIDRYCADRALDIPGRLRLFCDVCDAVSHAHRHLVVHRDLKPSNVLITGDGVPKLLDFGIAKLLSTDDMELAAVTATEMRVLTPDYAAPEQVRGEPVTTATDVYALGVLLFELLTGQRPHKFRTLRADEIERVVCETDVPSPRSIIRDLDRDLEIVTLTALQKDPVRRYGSVAAMAGDVRRYLEGLPIDARPSTWRYRAVRFAGRHRWSVTTAAAFVLTLVAFSIVVSVQAARIARERDRVQLERDTAEQVSAFLVDLFEVADPGESRGNTVTARELLDRGADQVDRTLAAQPAVRARLKDTIGRVYRTLGLYERSTEVLQAALTTREGMLGREHADTAWTMENLGESFRERGQLERAEQLQREALAVRRRVLPPVHAHIASSLNNLGLVLHARGKRDEAEPMLREALAMFRETLGPRHPQVAVALNNLSQLLRQDNRYDEAQKFLEEALDIRLKAFGEPHPLVANILMQIGQVANARGDLDAAEPPMRRALAMRQKLFGTSHAIIGMSSNNLASLLHDKGDLAAAEPLYRTGLEINRKYLGPVHGDVAVAMNNLASLLEDRGELDDAVPLFREALAVRQKALGEKHPAVARGLNNLARALTRAGALEEAEPMARRALEMRRSLLGEKHAEVAGSLSTIAEVAVARGDLAQAETLYRDALGRLEGSLKPDHPSVAAARFGLARVLLKRRQAAAAEPLARQAVDVRRRRLPAGHWQTAQAESVLGAALLGLGRAADGRPLLEAGTRRLADVLGPADPRTREALAWLR